jgi:hypothetical protein
MPSLKSLSIRKYAFLILVASRQRAALSVALDNSLSADKPIFKAILKKGYLAEKWTFELCLTPDITTLLIQPI